MSAKMNRSHMPATSHKALLKRYRARVELLRRDPFRVSERPARRVKVDWWALMARAAD